MNQTKNILTILLFFIVSFSFAHKDRISLPKTFIFVFKNKDTVKLNSADKDLIIKYSTDIANKKVDLTFAQIIFEDGEKAIFKRTADKWTSILLVDGKNQVTVTVPTLNKIPEIHFETIGLLWDWNFKKAFSASYFFLQFDIGNEKAFNEYPKLELFFSDNKYKKANLNRQIDEHTSQHRALRQLAYEGIIKFASLNKHFRA
jgi:hypothetical protein